MDIGRVIHQIAQPYNVLLLQNLGLDAAVGKITSQIFQLLKQIALHSVSHPVPDFDVKLPLHHFAGEGKPCLLYTSDAADE
mgnify:CR=1 FL=1